MNGHPDNETANQINEQDDNARDGIAFDEFTRPVHRTIEISFALDFAATFPRLLLVDESGIQVSVDTHLLTWHRIECETSRNLSDTLRALGNYDKLNYNQNQKHNKTDYWLSLRYPGTKGSDNVPRFGLSQNKLGSRYVKRQSEQCRNEQHCRENGKLQRLFGIHRDKQNHQGNRYVHNQ
ncbi:hypothetical protein D3C81_1476330 [compost metagenome]